MTPNETSGDYFIDSNGCPAERVDIGGQEVIVHYAHIPESDITSVDGIRCTTPLRTVIDLACQLGREDLAIMILHCIDRGLFTADEVRARVAQPDMQGRRGATFVLELINELSTGARGAS